MTDSVVVNEAGRTLLLWLGIAAGVGWGIAIPACLAWWDAERQKSRAWKAYGECSDERRALANGAPVHLVNVCRDCRALLRGHNS
jgi:hypothetical protein